MVLLSKLESDRVQNTEWSPAQDLPANTFKAENILSQNSFFKKKQFARLTVFTVESDSQ